MSEENDDKKSDIELDIEALSDARDIIACEMANIKNISSKVLLADSLIKIIKARQESELFQLRIWGVLENHDENCTECNSNNEQNFRDPSDSN